MILSLEREIRQRELKWAFEELQRECEKLTRVTNESVKQFDSIYQRFQNQRTRR